MNGTKNENSCCFHNTHYSNLIFKEFFSDGFKEVSRNPTWILLELTADSKFLPVNFLSHVVKIEKVSHVNLILFQVDINREMNHQRLHFFINFTSGNTRKIYYLHWMFQMKCFSMRFCDYGLKSPFMQLQLVRELVRKAVEVICLYWYIFMLWHYISVLFLSQSVLIDTKDQLFAYVVKVL